MKSIKPMVDKLEKFRFVKAIVLFGSYARKKATPLSDIDICVIDDQAYPKKERHKVYQYMSDKVSISLFSELPLYIKYEIFKHGKVLFCRDNTAFKRLTEKTVLEYLDSKWLWEQYFEARQWSIQQSEQNIIGYRKIL